MQKQTGQKRMSVSPGTQQVDRFQGVPQLRTLLSRLTAALPDSCRLPSPLGPSLFNLEHKNPKKPLGGDGLGGL